MPYMTFPQLKYSAMARLKPVMRILTGTTAAFFGLSLMAGQLSSASFLFSGLLPLQIVLHFLFTLLVGTFSRMLHIGFCCLMLKLYCGRPIAVSDLFYAFTAQTKTSIRYSLIMAALNVVPMIPFYIFSTKYTVTMNDMDLTIALFCYTPALVLKTMLNLIYSQAVYLMLDFPARTIKQLFSGSRLLMRGHKGRLFYIRVCLLPFILLIGGCTCGIGMLWLMPFIYAVQTEFYLDLMTKKRMPAKRWDIPAQHFT